MQILGIDIRIYFLLFMIYSVSGWTMEVIGKLIQYKRFINRGFLIGPYCPIYGYGAMLITFLLNKYIGDPIALFVMAIFVCGILEYATSYYMEKMYKARWWDYSQRKFNINGRVCLNTIIPFGLLGLFIMYVSNPFLLSKLNLLPEVWLNILFWTLLTIFITDNIVSGVVIRYVKKTEKDLGPDLDNTEEITKKVRQVLESKSVLHRRLLNAYPDLEAVKIKIKQKKEKIKEQVEEQKKELEKKVEDKSKQVEEKLKNRKLK
jgi:uncharacterized membrane protein